MIQSTVSEPYSGCESGVWRIGLGQRLEERRVHAADVDDSACAASRPLKSDSRAIHAS